MITRISRQSGYLLSYLLIPILIGCRGTSPSSEDQHLAKVGNTVLTVEQAMEQVPDHMLKMDSISALKRYREDWVQRQIILQEARRLEISRNPDVRKRLERLQEEVMIQGLKDYVMAEYEESLMVTDEEAQNYYQTNKDRLVLNEKYVRFRHVIASTMEEARSAKRDLMRGIEWPDVAREYSDEPEVRIQESDKFWPISMALADNTIMNRMLRRIGITEISPIYRVNGDYHFVQLMETRAQGDHPDLDWLMDQIKEWLRLEKRRRHFNSYVKNLYLNAQSNNEIEVFNVLNTESNSKSLESDTLSSPGTNE